MRIHGIHLDVGTAVGDGTSSRPSFSADEIESEVRDIALGLHANAIRVTGSDVDRIATTSAIAGRYGLEVWVSPMLPNADAATTLQAIKASARVADDVRRTSGRAVLVVGCELSAFMSGILPGKTHFERLALLGDQGKLMAAVMASGVDPQAAFAAFMHEAVTAARATFAGAISYAAGLWEDIDWTPFDIVGVDAYRDAHNRPDYIATLRERVRHHRPVVVTELGCATYRGASDAGGMAWTAVDRTAVPRRLKEGIVRDEQAQADEIVACLDAIDTAGADGAFVYTYAAPIYPASSDARFDLDAASFSLVKTEPGRAASPKLAYAAVAERFHKA